MRYERISLLGQGSTARVYLCRDTWLGHFYAAKAADGKDPAALESLRRERAVLESLDHPGIPRVRDYICDESREEEVLIMTLARGRSLKHLKPEELLRKDLKGISGRLAWEALVASWGGQICQVLDYLHSREPTLVYCDLKPDNLLVDREGIIHMVDFGSVTVPDPSGKRLCCGTRGYAAPEQYPEEPGVLCPASDLYALGVLMRELLGEGISASMGSILERCLARSPEERPRGADELGRKLTSLARIRRAEVFLRENW